MAPNIALVQADATPGYQHLLDPTPWYRRKRLVALNIWIFILLITSYTNGFDGDMMNGLQTLKQWETAFNHPTGSRLGLLGAIQNIGGLAGLPFAPYVTDKLGRRAGILLGSIIMIIGTVLQTASQSVGMFIGARFLLGFGLTFATNAAPLLITEIAYPTHRAKLTSTYNSLWYSGSIVAAWTTFGTFRMEGSSWSWRIPSAMQGLASVIQVVCIFFIPESPRWLIGQGRVAEARKVLAYYHAEGNEEDPLVEFEHNEIVTAINTDAEINKNVGWSAFIRKPGNRKRMRIFIALAFFSQWSGNGLVSYYLNKVFETIGITSVAIQNLINGILQIWNLFWALFGAAFCDRIGRRPLFLISTAGMLVFFTCQTALSAVYANTAKDAAAHGVIAFIFLYYAAYDIAYSPLIVSYTVEILPYQLRAKGFTIFSFAISLSLIFNQYINPIALKALQWKYYLVYVAWLAFELVFMWFFIIETRNHTLEETAAIFDGTDAITHLHAREERDSESASIEKQHATEQFTERVAAPVSQMA
ncbi:general substrate transporter [Auricularia subglabra TFB-10046 SS5]|nr:general substrate transporter [Auricularia subglabra TFB-10046 SS5]